MQTIDNNNQVAIIENSLEVLKTGPQILIENKSRADKALSVGRNILIAIQEAKMDQVMDERAMKYLANVNAANKEMKDQRASVTQIMDSLKKMYTEVENELDVKRAGTIPAQIQAHRDQYVKEQAAEQERKRKEQELIAAKAKAAIELKYTAESRLNNHFNDLLLSSKNNMQNSFNSICLDDYEERSLKLKGLKPTYKESHFNSFEAKLYSPIHNAQELSAIEIEALAGKYQEFFDKYAHEMELLKDELVEKLPSKLAELKEQKHMADEAAKAQAAAAAAKGKAAKEAAEKAAIEAKQAQVASAAAQKRREQDQEAKMQAEADEAKRQQELEADIKKQGEETMVMFEQEAAMADSAPAPEARQGYEITVLHPVGFTQIFALWFEKIGKDLPIDKLGNTKLDQMKAWAEKEAHKSGTKIESKFIKYEESFKAINRKATA